MGALPCAWAGAGRAGGRRGRATATLRRGIPFLRAHNAPGCLVWWRRGDRHHDSDSARGHLRLRTSPLAEATSSWQPALPGPGPTPSLSLTAAPRDQAGEPGARELAGHGPKGRAWVAPCRPTSPTGSPRSPNVRAGPVQWAGPLPGPAPSSPARPPRPRHRRKQHSPNARRGPCSGPKRG